MTVLVPDDWLVTCWLAVILTSNLLAVELLAY